jgi:hypothetical protein
VSEVKMTAVETGNERSHLLASVFPAQIDELLMAGVSPDACSRTTITGDKLRDEINCWCAV